MSELKPLCCLILILVIIVPIAWALYATMLDGKDAKTKGNKEKTND